MGRSLILLKSLHKIKFQELRARNVSIYSNNESHAPEELAESTYFHSFSTLVQLLAWKGTRLQEFP